MTNSGRYPSAPIGEELGRFYNHRSLLRRTIPLFSLSWQDVIRSLKGEALMTAATPQKSDHHHHGGSQHQTPLHARA